MCDCSDNPAIICNCVSRKARKSHRCDECRRTIVSGETYEEHSGLWRDGGWNTYRWCAHCSAAQKILESEINDAARKEWMNSSSEIKRWGFERPFCFCFTAIWDAVDEMRGGYELSGTQAMRLLGGARRKWMCKRGKRAGQLMPVPAMREVAVIQVAS
jgi:hypothetical protein